MSRLSRNSLSKTQDKFHNLNVKDFPQGAEIKHNLKYLNTLNRSKSKSPTVSPSPSSSGIPE